MSHCRAVLSRNFTPEPRSFAIWRPPPGPPLTRKGSQHSGHVMTRWPVDAIMRWVPREWLRTQSQLCVDRNDQSAHPRLRLW